MDNNLLYKKKTSRVLYPKGLKKGQHSATGRNNRGRITAWHRGGCHKRLYRKIDLTRKNTHGIILGLEYDPNRSSFLACVFNPDEKKHIHILAPTGLKRGDVIRSNSTQSGLQNGHSKPLKHILIGSLIYNISTKPNLPGKFLRAAGAHGQLVQQTGGFSKIKLKSGQNRWFDNNTMATNGIVSDPNFKFKKLRKAGQSRWRGRRPIVRGVAMNPIDHPHGGGEGKTSGGRPSVSPWAKPAKSIKHKR